MGETDLNFKSRVAMIVSGALEFADSSLPGLAPVWKTSAILRHSLTIVY